jgi:hypothetical protein
MITFGFFLTQYLHVSGETNGHPLHFPAKWFGFSMVCMGIVLPLFEVVLHIARIQRLTNEDLSGRSVRNLAVMTGFLLALLGFRALMILLVII